MRIHVPIEQVSYRNPLESGNESSKLFFEKMRYHAVFIV